MRYREEAVLVRTVSGLWQRLNHEARLYRPVQRDRPGPGPHHCPSLGPGPRRGRPARHAVVLGQGGPLRASWLRPLAGDRGPLRTPTSAWWSLFPCSERSCRGCGPPVGDSGGDRALRAPCLPLARLHAGERRVGRMGRQGQSTFRPFLGPTPTDPSACQARPSRLPSPSSPTP